MENRIRLYQFYAAIGVIAAGLSYCFVCIWIKPAIDLTVPVFGLMTLMAGYYYGSSKGTQDNSDAMESRFANLPYYKNMTKCKPESKKENKI